MEKQQYRKCRWVILAGLLALILLPLRPAYALELRADTARPFGDNPITVISETGGELTLQAFQGTLELAAPLEPLTVEAGETSLSWQALTYYGEPILRGRVRLRATLTRPDGAKEEAEIRVGIGRPHSVAVSCSPAQERFYANGKNHLKIECSLALPGACLIEITRREDPETLVWRSRKTTSNGLVSFWWDGKNGERELCEPGEYVITAYGKARPEITVSSELTLLAQDPGELRVAITGPLLPEDLTDDEAVWQALTAPIVVGRGAEGQGLLIYEKNGYRMTKVASVNCATVGITVLEPADETGWVRVGVWRQNNSVYTEGYVEESKLMTVRPNTRYGAVLDKQAQTLTVYEQGKKMGSVQVSTGLTNRGRLSETNSGAYLLGDRLTSFVNGRYTYNYPIRIDGFNMIHSLGYTMKNGEADYADQIEELGRKASHGCARLDVRGDRGLTAWWIWTHMGRNMKILITDDH